MPNLSKEAKQGLEALKKSNPELAKQVSQTMSDTGETQDIDYTKKPDETVEEYKSRIQQARDETPTADEMGDTTDTTAAAEEDDGEDQAEADARTADAEAAGALGASTLQELRESRQKAREEAQKATEQFREATQGVTSEAQLRQQQAEKVGLQAEQQDVSQQEAKVAEIKGQLSEIRQEKRAKMDKAEDRLASTSQIKAEQQRIRREYNREIADVSSTLSAENALLQAEQGQLERAQTNIQNAVDAKLRSQEREVQRMRRVANQANEWYSSLDETTQNYMDRVMEQKENALKRQRERAETNRGLVMEALDKGVSVSAETITNIPTASTQEILQEVAPKIAIAEKEKQQQEGVIELSPNNQRELLGAGFTTSEIKQIEQDVSAGGLQAVLNNITGENAKEQKDALKRVYGAKDQQSLNDYIENNLTDEDLQNYAEKMDLTKPKEKDESWLPFYKGTRWDTESAKQKLKEIAARQKRLGAPTDDILEQLRTAVTPSNK